MPGHMRRQLEIMPHFTHRYPLFRERKCLNKCSNKTQNGATKQPDLFFCSLYPCFPPQRTIAWLVSLCSRSRSRYGSSSKSYSTFPPIRFSFPLNSLTLTRTHTSRTHTSLSYLWPWQSDCCLVVR